LALSGSLVNQFSTGYRVLIEWTATQNISANTSTITAKFYLQSMGSGYPIYSSAKKTVRITIDGTTYTSAENTAQLAGGQKKLMATATKTVQHNADGTKSITISGSIDLNATLSGTYYGTVNIAQQSFTLDTIPRASSVSVSSSNVQFGKSVTISISRASSSFTHTLRYSVAGQSGTIATGVGTSYSWTVPTSLINGLTNTKSATCTIYCDTYSGSTLIGTKSVTLTLTIPTSSASLSASSVNYGSSVTISISRAHTKLTHTIRYNWNGNTGNIATNVATSQSWTVPMNFMNYIPNATSTTGTIYVDTYNGTALVGTVSLNLKTNVPSSVVPSFNTVTHSEANSAVAALSLGSGVYVQNLSKLNLAITGAQGAYGSTITSYKITVDGKTYTTQTATTNTITGKGTLKIIATITDSRGRTATKEVNITVLEYNPPKIDSIKARRSNQDGSSNDLGTYIRIDYKGSNIYTLNSKNVITVYIDVKERTSSTWETKESFTVTQGFEGYKILGSASEQYDITKSYDIRFRIVDKFYTTLTTLVISTGIVTISLGKTGIGLGKILEGGALDIGGRTRINSNGNALQLIGQGHNYISYYPRGFNEGRKGWIGYGSNGSTHLQMINEDSGDIYIKATNGNVFLNGINVLSVLDSALKDTRTTLNSETIDWDTLEPGIYRVSRLGINAPTGVYNYGMLLVAQTSTGVLQAYFPHSTTSNNKPWYRVKYNASDWRDWLPLAIGFLPEVVVVTRDGTTSGTQTVSLSRGRAPAAIICFASTQSPATQYIAVGMTDFVRERCINFNGSTYGVVTTLVRLGSSSNYVTATISNRSDSSLTLTWTLYGSGVNATVTLYWLVFYY
jgi:hypothetical protein